MIRRALALTCCLAAVAGATPSGHKWGFKACPPACLPTEQCVGGRCVPTWRVGTSVGNTGGMTLNGPGVPYSAVLSRTPEAFLAWTQPKVSSCSTSWEITQLANYSAPAGVAAIAAMDGYNNVQWIEAAQWRHSAPTLGLTTVTYLLSTGQIVDADMELNNGKLWANDGSTGGYDFESVVLHEAGHFLGLDHTTFALAVMYASVSPGTVKRELHTADEDDVCTVYSAPGGLGDGCASPAECSGGRVCEAVAGETQEDSCTQDCTGAGQACPTGYSCQASTTGFACLPQIGASDHCRFCASGQDCNTGVCLRTVTGGITFCSSNCSTDGQCPSNNTCVMTASGGYCVPNTSCTNQCTGASQCPTGYTCTGGTCTPNGNPGDRCEVSTWCQSSTGGPCSVCVLDPGSTTIAFCRACCMGNSGTGFCQGCALAACTAPETCLGLTNGQDAVCLASGAGALPGACQLCQGGQCAQGLQCLAGRCHGPCNPSAPGQCTACFDLGGGTGACACTDEVVHEAEPCGVIAGNQIAVCTQGLACVGSPQTVCRVPCELGNPASCREGEVCQQQGPVAVCQPGAAGNKCSPCAGSGTCNAGLQCYLGRCYETCNLNVGTTCGTCVATEPSGVGVCGCADQISGENEPCGGEPEVKACQPGNRCLNGVCRAECDPAAPFNCPVLTECQSLPPKYYCQDQGGLGGGGGGGSGGARGGGAGGGGGGSVSSLGCGCGAGGSVLGLWPLLVIAVRRRRWVAAR